MDLKPCYMSICQIALLPALNRNEVENIGVFETLGDPTPKKIVLLIPYKGVAHFEKVLNALEKDTNYQKNKKAYDELPLSQESLHAL